MIRFVFVGWFDSFNKYVCQSIRIESMFPQCSPQLRSMFLISHCCVQSEPNAFICDTVCVHRPDDFVRMNNYTDLIHSTKYLCQSIRIESMFPPCSSQFRSMFLILHCRVQSEPNALFVIRFVFIVCSSDDLIHATKYLIGLSCDP